jgi:hypothetical protein
LLKSHALSNLRDSSKGKSSLKKISKLDFTKTDNCHIVKLGNYNSGPDTLFILYIMSTVDKMCWSYEFICFLQTLVYHYICWIASNLDIGAGIPSVQL